MQPHFAGYLQQLSAQQLAVQKQGPPTSQAQPIASHSQFVQPQFTQQAQQGSALFDLVEPKTKDPVTKTAARNAPAINFVNMENLRLNFS